MKFGRIALLGLACALPQVLLASDPPDSRYNLVTGLSETVDTVVIGSQYEIRYTTSDGTTKPVATILTSNSKDDRRPRIAVSPLGETTVCWYRETTPSARVLCRQLQVGSSTWSPERVVSDPNEDSRLPVVVHDGLRAWVAFEVADGSDTGIAVNSVDEPDPIIYRTVLAYTSFGGDVDIQLHRALGHLWVTWIDSSWEIAWSEYNYTTGQWDNPQHLPYWFSQLQFTLDLIEGLVLAP